MSEFKTVFAHISDLRTLIKSTSDDSQYPDSFLYKKLMDARAYILEQELNKKKKLSEWNMQHVCIKLELAPYVDCSCVPNLDCKVLRSVQEIPKPLSSKYATILQVRPVSGDIAFYPSSPFKERLNRWSKTRQRKLGWEFVNGHLVIFMKKGLAPKVVLLSVVAEDPLAFSSLTACTTDGTDTSQPCYDLATSDFPLEARLNNAVYQVVLSQLGLSLKLPDDQLNNAQTNTLKTIA